METLKKFESFHDWYLMGISADMKAGVVELALMFDDGKARARVRFKGASRCHMNDFLIQNIIYDAKILTDYSASEYKRALDSLETSYFGKENHQPKPIAVFAATLGAELLVEFETVDVVSGSTELP
ncbi:hypothetical protein A6V36_14830 [Paraburkholderia ginsengiterrae]|uniref:Uncharacterized protein n=1 Tax=Paraburkholderia ginsengiterrae TaxID=1462993 RepID=A0A1A9N6J5_9BURK|nr:hypothetical protein [Paraburkholderia ginsengiterrae]OAJ51843.1 hypothetical protein A6V36_14830 [Paraburkholderia ginsengiterrae]OAJ59951.1 hypothetical protein A6V37_26215 [Paraburkholderia ginsengiterrae]